MPVRHLFIGPRHESAGARRRGQRRGEVRASRGLGRQLLRCRAAGSRQPNDRAAEPQIAAAYQRFGLNDRQIEILSRAIPKRDYYCQSRQGNRLFELGLGSVALALCAASSKADQVRIGEILSLHGPEDFASAWLAHRGLAWAADLVRLPKPPRVPQEVTA